MIRTAVAAIAFIVLAPGSVAQASPPPALDAQSARAVGLAGAVTAANRDPASAFHNPAALAGMRGTLLQFSGSALGAWSNYVEAQDEPILGPWPIQIALATSLLEPLALGIAIGSPVAGREFGRFPELSDADLSRLGIPRERPTWSATISGRSLEPAVAYRITSQLSVSAGAQLVQAQRDFEATGCGATACDLLLYGRSPTWNALGAGPTASMLGSFADDALRVALTYRGRVRKLSGDGLSTLAPHRLSLGTAVTSGALQVTLDAWLSGAERGWDFPVSNLFVASGAEWRASEQLFVRFGARYAWYSRYAQRYWLLLDDSGYEVGASLGIGYALTPRITLDAAGLWAHSLEPAPVSFDSLQMAVSVGFAME